MRKATLCLLVKDNQILLAMKKRGFGEGRWNGVGGKPNPEEEIEAAAIRETIEEIGVTPKNLKRVATLDFLFPSIPEDKNWNQQVCVYLVDNWEGEPVETEEMAPKWFEIEEIPFNSMWEDDIHWLPKVLSGNLLQGEFTFDADQNLQNFKITEGTY